MATTTTEEFLDLDGLEYFIRGVKKYIDNLSSDSEGRKLEVIDPKSDGSVSISSVVAGTDYLISDHVTSVTVSYSSSFKNVSIVWFKIGEPCVLKMSGFNGYLGNTSYKEGITLSDLGVYRVAMWDSLYGVDYIGSIDFSGIEHINWLDLSNWASINYPDSYTTLESFDVIPSDDELMYVNNAVGCFNNCMGIINVPFNILGGVNINCSNMYRNCVNLVETPSFPSNTTNLRSAFLGCTNLTTAPSIPDSVTDIEYTFSGCNKLTCVPYLGSNVTALSYTFNNCTNLVSVPEIPNSVTNIYGIFNNCVNLTAAPSLGTGLINVINAFRNCINLQGDIYIYSEKVNSATNCFNGCNNYEKNIYVPEGSTTYDTFYKAMGNSTTNSAWNATLKTFTV